MVISSVYSNGLPFDDTLAKNLKAIKDLVNRGFASVIIVEGGLGQGKTTLAVEIANYINSISGLDPVDLKERYQVGFGASDFEKKLLICKDMNLPVVVYDESGDFNKRGAMGRLNKALIGIFQKFRSFKVVVILCLPAMEEIDNSIFKYGIVRLNLRLFGRTNSYGRFKAYSARRTDLLRSKMMELKIKRFAYTLVTPNFYGQFKNLPPELAELLARKTDKLKANSMSKDFVKIDGLKSYNDICISLGIQRARVGLIVRRLGLQPDRTVNQIRYFSEEQFKAIKNYQNEERRGRPSK